MLVLGFLYGGVTYSAPQIAPLLASADQTAQYLLSTKPAEDSTRLYIPRLNINSDISDITSNERSSEGGILDLSAPRYTLGLTPMETIAKSPLFRVSEVKSGDDVYLDHAGKRYAYKVTDTSSDTGEQLTIKACGRECSDSDMVIRAEPVGSVVWSDGKPSLRSL